MLVSELKDLGVFNAIGKTIKHIEPKETRDGRSVDRVILHLTNGSKLEISAGSHKGCHRCDPDGSVNDYLNVYLNKD